MFTIIGYCPVCGDPVIAKSAKTNNKTYCSTKCGNRAKNRRMYGLPISDKENEYANPKRQPKKTAREIQLEHLAARDQLWAENAAPVSTREVESNGTVYVVETRGAVRIAPRIKV